MPGRERSRSDQTEPLSASLLTHCMKRLLTYTPFFSLSLSLCLPHSLLLSHSPPSYLLPLFLRRLKAKMRQCLLFRQVAMAAVRLCVVTSNYNAPMFLLCLPFPCPPSPSFPPLSASLPTLSSAPHFQELRLISS